MAAQVIEDDPATQVARGYATASKVGAILIAALWHFGYDLTATVTHWPEYRFPWLNATAWLVYLIVGAAAAARRMPVVPGVVLSLALTPTVLLVCTHEAVLGPANWAWGSIGWLGVLLLWDRKWWWLLGFLLANAILMFSGMAVAGALDDTSLARYFAVIVGSMAIQLGYSAGARAIDRAVQRAATWSVARAEVETRHQAEVAAHASRVERYAVLRQDPAMLLAELHNGADPGDPALQRQCALAATRLRRLLAEIDQVPDKLVHELQAVADIAERRGVTLTFDVVGSIPEELDANARRHLTEGAVQALVDARHEARVTVICTPGEVVVGVVADDGRGRPVWIDKRWPER